MNRETPIHASSDTVVVIDDSARRRRRIAIIGIGIVAIVAIFLALTMLRGSKSAPAGADSGPGAQVPTVTVVVPGKSQVARTVAASGPLAARRDQPIGIAGQGGRVTR